MRRFLSRNKPSRVFDVKPIGPKARILLPGVVNLRPDIYKRHPILVGVFVVVLAVLGTASVSLFTGRAEVLDMYPSVCLGTWQSAPNAEGVPETWNTGVLLSENNSALYLPKVTQAEDGDVLEGATSTEDKATPLEIFCAGFLGSGEEAPDGEMTSAAITLVWNTESSIVSTTEDIMDDSLESPASTSTEESSTTPTEEEQTTNNNATSSNESEETIEPEPAPEPEPKTFPNPESEEETSNKNDTSLISRFLRAISYKAFAEDTSATTEESTEPQEVSEPEPEPVKEPPPEPEPEPASNSEPESEPIAEDVSDPEPEPEPTSEPSVSGSTEDMISEPEPESSNELGPEPEPEQDVTSESNSESISEPEPEPTPDDAEQETSSPNVSTSTEDSAGEVKGESTEEDVIVIVDEQATSTNEDTGENIGEEDTTSSTPIIIGDPIFLELSTSTEGEASSTEEKVPEAGSSFVEFVTESDDNFLKISYSFDGNIWLPLGKANPQNIANLTFPLDVSDWQDLADLQIRIEEIENTLDNIPHVYLDGMFIEVKYELDPIIPEPIKDVLSVIQPAEETDEIVNQPENKSENKSGSVSGVSASPASSPVEPIYDAKAEHECTIEPFSSKASLGEIVSFNANLIPSGKADRFTLRSGDTAGNMAIDIGEAVRDGENINVPINASISPDADLGSFNIVIVYEEHLGTTVLPNFCQFNIIIK